MREFHIRIVKTHIALAVIAANTSGYQILPGILSSPRFRNDVIDRQRCFCTTVLALMPVAAKDILPRKYYAFKGNMDVIRKADHTRKCHRGMSRMDAARGTRTYYFRFIEEEQDNRFLHAADRKGFVVAVEE